MKKVVRYQCSFCQKTAARPETMAEHEKECLKNPNSRNCYLCERAVQGGYRQDRFGGDYWDGEAAFCSWNEEPLDLLRAQGFTAKDCENFIRTDEMYYERKGEQ